MLKRFSCLFLLVAMLFCSITLSRTFSKYLLSKSIDGEITTRANCIDMGITSLSECMLVMDTTTSNVESAKFHIASKEADFTRMAPVINYKTKTQVLSNSNGIITSNNYLSLSTSYSFDNSTGMFTLSDDWVNDVLNDDYIGYYTCGGNNGSYYYCPTVYKILEYTRVEGTNTVKVTKAEVTSYVFSENFSDVEIGLYSEDDDYGTSYYYRGNVKNNYVSYAGFIWRIVRQNGDGSIRMIYAGKSTSATGKDTTIGNYRYNEKISDPTYVGYMHSENFVKQTSASAVGYTNFLITGTYYFANDYSFDETTKRFSLSGDMISGVWRDNYEEIIANYPYTCFKTDNNETCAFILKARFINGLWGNESTMYANIISYSSTDYDSTLKNTTDSDVKKTIDNWYENNILNVKDINGNLYSNYLSDEIFCNDRTFYSGNGYSLTPTTFYNGHRRAAELNAPTLKCSQFSDKFTVDENNGNGSLIYPIGLLTADEVIYAGALHRAINNQFYLYNGFNNMTMTPQLFHSNIGSARIMFFGSGAGNGTLYGGATNLFYYVRPVINLKANIQITEGDGTAENPYFVSL